MNLKQIATAISVTAAAASVALAGVTITRGAPVEADTSTRVVTAAAPVAQARKTSIPAPTTARGYARAFGRLGAAWGGGDVALTAEVGARRVWLFGDTLSRANGFVHSTAVVQTGGRFHVSNGGRVMLPETAGTYYWPERVQSVNGTQVSLLVRDVRRTGQGAWDFEATGLGRVALLRVTPAGNVLFERWASGDLQIGQKPAGATRIVGANHYAYGRLEHSAVRLAGGKTLVTESQNWDDALRHHRHHNFRDYRPVFVAQ